MELSPILTLLGSGHQNLHELSSIPTLLGSGHQNLRETYQCRMYSRKLLMMGREVARKT